VGKYQDKWKDPRWQKRRLEVFARDDWRCRLCNNGKRTLAVHHRVYSSGNPWDEPMDDLVTLCEDCHAAFHEPLPVKARPLPAKMPDTEVDDVFGDHAPPLTEEQQLRVDAILRSMREREGRDVFGS